MAVNWALGLSQANPYQSFQQGLEIGRQRQRENYLMGLQRDQLARQQETRDAQVRVGKHVAASDLSGARVEAAQSGDLGLLQAVNQLTADQRAQVAAQQQTLAPIYHRLRQMPDIDQRRAELQRLAPALAARGIPPEAIANYDPTDANLDSDIALGMTLEQIQARDQINWQVIPQVGAFATDYTGRPVNPSQMGGQAPAIHSAQPPTAAPVQAVPQAQAPEGPAGDYGAAVGAVLSQAGVPAPVVAGILGNGHHESGGWNIANSGDDNTAHGAFQWRGPRAENFRRITGADPRQATPEQTAQFVLWEFQNPEQAGMTREQVQEILNAGTPEEAARLFSRYYERPNRALAHDDRRVALAAQYAGGTPMQTAQAGPVPTPGQQPSIQDQAATGVIQAARPAPPGYQWTPQGQLQAIPGGPGDQTYQRQQDRTQTTREQRQEFGSLQNQFRSDPDVRAWRQARTSVFQLRNLGQSGSPTDDIAMVFMFMKTVDPPSTVREGEQATVQNAAGVPNRIRNYYNQLMTGQRLTPEQRQDLIRTAERLYIDRSRTYNELVDSYRQQAVNIPGISRDQVGNAFQRAVAPEDADRRQQQRRSQGRTRTGNVRWRRVN